MCNTSYKTIIKILVNRMRPFLDQIISPFQASYVLGRRLVNNVVILREIMHTLNTKKSKTGLFIFKLDLKKHMTK